MTDKVELSDLSWKGEGAGSFELSHANSGEDQKLEKSYQVLKRFSFDTLGRSLYEKPTMVDEMLIDGLPMNCSSQFV